MQLTSLRSVGNSVGLTIQSDLRVRSGMQSGDTVAVQSRDGDLVIRSITAHQQSILETYENTVDQFRDGLAVLGRE